MNFPQMKSIIEGLLFVAGDEGLDARQLADVMELEPKQVEEAIHQLREQFKIENRGIQIAEIAGSYQLTTNAEHAIYFERLAYSPSRSSLSQAALETLSIVAYRQPITRVEIEEIRGVKAERALHTLVSKDLIEEVGRAEAPGRPILYGTTKSFLDHFGLKSLKDLPDSSLFEVEPDQEDASLFDTRYRNEPAAFDEPASDIVQELELDFNTELDKE